MAWTPQDTISAIGAITALIAALSAGIAGIISAVKANAKVDAATQRLNSQADSIRQTRDQLQTMGNSLLPPEMVVTHVAAIATDAAQKAVNGAMALGSLTMQPQAPAAVVNIDQTTVPTSATEQESPL